MCRGEVSTGTAAPELFVKEIDAIVTSSAATRSFGESPMFTVTIAHCDAAVDGSMEFALLPPPHLVKTMIPARTSSVAKVLKPNFIRLSFQFLLSDGWQTEYTRWAQARCHRDVTGM